MLPGGYEVLPVVGKMKSILDYAERFNLMVPAEVIVSRLFLSSIISNPAKANTPEFQNLARRCAAIIPQINLRLQQPQIPQRPVVPAPVYRFMGDPVPVGWGAGRRRGAGNAIEQRAEECIINRVKESYPLKDVPLVEVNVYGISLKIQQLEDNVVKIIDKALKITPDIDPSKASTYLRMIYKAQIPDDIVDRFLLAARDKKTVQSRDYKVESLLLLSNLFKQYSQNDIRKYLDHSQWNLNKAIESIKSKPPHQTTETRSQTPNITLTDPFISYQLLKQMEIEEKRRAEEEAAAQEAAEIEQARLDGSLIECGCCCCEVPIDRCVQCPEGHIFCRQCVLREVETKIAEGQSTVRCMAMGGCDREIPLDMLERAVPPKTLQRLIQTEVMNDLARSGLENLVTCAGCGFIAEVGGNANMRCPQCGEITCRKCGRKAHPGQTCDEADPERAIEEKMNDAVIRTCPKCRTPFTKEEGCNKMTCPRCGTLICYWCRKVIPPEVGYDHFWRKEGPCPPDKCPLWVENKDLHVIEAARAKLQAEGKIE